MALISTSEMAAKLGISPRAVRFRARALGVAPATIGRTLAWKHADVMKLRKSNGPGRPRGSVKV